LKVGVISDSHGDINAVKKAIESMGKVDIIVHLGDFYKDAQKVSQETGKNIIYVKGNCDFSSTVECDRIINVENKKVLCTHGHNYNVKHDYTTLYFKALEDNVDLVLFGHTHFPEVFENNNIMFVNPGSLSRPRGLSRTFAVVDFFKGLIVPNLIEL